MLGVEVGARRLCRALSVILCLKVLGVVGEVMASDVCVAVRRRRTGLFCVNRRTSMYGIRGED